MSTLNVANISDDQSTLSNSINSSDVLNNTTTVDTKFVTNGSAKAWVTFDQSVSPIGIYGSLNVSSIEDEGTGSAKINFFSYLNGVNQCLGIASNVVSSNLTYPHPTNMRARTTNNANSVVDTNVVCSTAHGELA